VTVWTHEQKVIHARAWEAATEAVTRWHASQRFDELVALLDIVALDGEPDVIVEIGCDAGGTLFAWRAMFPSARVFGVTLDDNRPVTGGQGYPVNEHGATVLIGDSHDRATLQRLKDQLGGRKVDVLFIDGDHSYDGVTADWSMYAPLVRAGGLTVFHDVANDSPMTAGARAFWEEMKRECADVGEPVIEIASETHRPVGFGIVRMAGE
jgi:cephalosporin hydroxylase